MTLSTNPRLPEQNHPHYRFRLHALFEKISLEVNRLSSRVNVDTGPLPTTGQYPGQQRYNHATNRPVWWNGGNWHYSDGTPV